VSVYLTEIVTPENSPYMVAAYLGDDYPRAWPIPMSGPVLMPLENTVRYELDSPNSEPEWGAMTPRNGIIHLGEQRRPFSISMFHRRIISSIQACLVFIARQSFGVFPSCARR
jgi:hypothetical protein